MRIGIIGDGRMGRAVAALAAERGIGVPVMLAEVENVGGRAIREGGLQSVDCAIEFTQPESAVDNVLACVETGVPVVVGTTGWYERLPEVLDAVHAHAGAVLWAPNFSVGVLLFAALVERAGELFGDSGFGACQVETHHTAKKDAPSGTAQMLAKAFAAGGGGMIPTTSVRVGYVPGTHEVVLDSQFEQVRLTHAARDRRVFADGALRAAEWLPGHQGVFTMRDVLGLEPERNA